MKIKTNKITLTRNKHQEEFLITDSTTVKIVDSFVAPSNKKGSGSGEARLYISSQSTQPMFNFSKTEFITRKNKQYHICKEQCFLSKDNLQKYLEDAKVEYLHPKETYRDDVTLLYEDRLQEVANLNKSELYFNIFNQNGALDSNRFYIGSDDDDIWNLIRELSLPKITELNIYKIKSVQTETILYYFELVATSSDISKIKKRNGNLSTKETIKNQQNIIINDTSISSTEKTAIVSARRGQGKFRKNTLSIMPSCPFTGIKTPSLLRASHILPWADCSNNNQRLDGYNGLSLTPTYDVLFDSGLISFEDDGTLLISSRLSNKDIKSLNLTAGKRYDIKNVSHKRDNYLDYHRKNIFND